MSLFSYFWGRGLPLSESKTLKPFEKKLHYSFRDLRLLKRALTHRSFANENHLGATEHNERYEFLGDAVLELAVSHMLMFYFPESSEGDMSKLRAAVVNEESLAELARAIDLGNYLYLGRGEEQCQGRTKDSLLSDALEAVLGAIYLDSGYPHAFRVIKRHLGKILEKALNQDIIRDFKTKLQEASQEKFKSIPQYQLISELGPDHDKTFEVHLVIKKEIYGRGIGKSKKQAEQMAAKEALIRIEGA